MTLYPQERRMGLDWNILLLLSTAYLALSINVQGFMALLPLLKVEFALTRAQTGLYSTFYFISATSLAILSGRVVDLVGAKKGALLGVFSVGIFFLLHAAAPSYSIILLLAFLTGIGFSLITPAVNKGVMEAVAPKRRALSLGIMQSGLGIGGLLGASILPIFAQEIGWRQTLVITGFFALLLGLVIYYFLQLDGQERSQKKQDSSSLSLPMIVKDLLTNRVLLGLSFFGFVFGISTSSMIAHFAIFLHQDLGFTLSMAGAGLGILHLGGMIGRPGFGYLDGTLFFGNHLLGLFCIGNIMGLLILLFSFFSLDWIPALPFFFFLTFLLGATNMGGHTLFFTAISEAAEIHTGTATGLALLFMRLGILSSPPLFGLIADRSGTYASSWMILGLLVLFLNSLLFFLTRAAAKKA